MSTSLAAELAAFEVEPLEPVPPMEMSLESLGYGALGGTEVTASCCASTSVCSCCVLCCCCCCT